MIKGSKVGLRSIEEQDLDKLQSWRNNSELRVYFREYRELNKQNQYGWYNNVVSNSKNTIMFGIINLQTENLIGACGLCYIDWINRSAELSVYIGEKKIYIDDIYATEATELLETYGFEEVNLNRIWCEVYSFDEKKIKLLNEAGYILEGRLRSTHWTKGSWYDSYIYGKLLSEQ
ncbi:GNAT family protein [Gracilibacillus sp. YIM 98692]|uniref:GNAT family N-acetyltransferase n=1 Tax=Gracilibacillus sp. YIM 98692 TaxID=2663532 RepID=UPI0013D0BC81|nr:GNAT family protein [Gracilibacillus sp. YIM 98692]